MASCARSHWCGLHLHPKSGLGLRVRVRPLADSSGD
jgi:hypothetical protein